MAKTLDSVIRLSRWQVDEKRRQLGELHNLLDSLEAEGEQIKRSMARESEIALASPQEAGLTIGKYIEEMIDRRERLSQSIAQTEQGIAIAIDELSDAYLELKKFEIVQAEREKKEALELSRREQIELDEIATKAFVRNRR